MLIGVVGKPNCGKSTFFKAATLSDVLIANYPFATIKPNTGVAYIRVPCVDQELNVHCNPRVGTCTNHQRFIPIELVDVAGLVPGAHQGKGLGLAFLNDLNAADALIHIIDCAGSTNEKGEPVQPGTYDPTNDVQFLEHELDHWYLNILTKGWEKLARTIHQEKQNTARALTNQLSGVKVTETMTHDAIQHLPPNPTEWNAEQLLHLASELRKKSKPMLIAANKIDLPTAEKNLQRLKHQFPHLTIIPCSGDAELALREANKKRIITYLPGDPTFTITGTPTEQQRQALNHIQTTVLDNHGNTGVQHTLNAATFDLLHSIAVFPGGVNKLSDSEGRILPDCFLLPLGTTALDFAYKIHTDLGENFIKAIDVKTKKTISKDYALHHRDVIEIITKH